jgi:hypothetical protein
MAYGEQMLVEPLSNAAKPRAGAGRGVGTDLLVNRLQLWRDQNKWSRATW